MATRKELEKLKQGEKVSVDESLYRFCGIVDELYAVEFPVILLSDEGRVFQKRAIDVSIVMPEPIFIGDAQFVFDGKTGEFESLFIVNKPDNYREIVTGHKFCPTLKDGKFYMGG